MTPKYQPCPGNAPGAFYVVDGQCLACHAAVDAAPALMTGDRSTGYWHCRFHRQPQNEEEWHQAIDAIKVCCTCAIRYTCNDKTILDRIDWPSVCDALPESDGLGFPRNPS